MGTSAGRGSVSPAVDVAGVVDRILIRGRRGTPASRADDTIGRRWHP